MIPFLHGQTVTVIRRTANGTDDYGNVTYTTTSTAVAGCGVYPRNLGDITESGRDGITIGLTVHLPPGTDIRGTDSVTVGGANYRIIGDPGVWHHPMSGWRPGITVDLERVEG